MKQEVQQVKLWNFDEPLSYMDVLKAFERTDTWYTRRQIAENLRRSKSPTLVLLLTDLAAEGFLRIDSVLLPNHVQMFIYQLTERGCDAILHNDLPPDAFRPR